ncbi:hypothetical protein GZ998_12605 [Actinomyces sp. 594]|uniref:hypothetical protein n=1 Tax=Actinomyces sp. 594 TaxID=2057793 RepID=UPI001C57EDFC|nr:hypothetical protein [Actinomyces sp. 594]MBW3070337.1 hypothetical protein [Actinomyces sp. 594]
MSEREDVRGDERQSQATALVGNEGDEKEADQEPESQKNESTNGTENKTGAEQSGRVQRILRWVRGPRAAQKDDSAIVPLDLGQDPSLEEGKDGRIGSREKRDKRYERGLVWEHGGNIAMLTVPGLLGICVWALCVMIDHHGDNSPELLLSELAKIRAVGRRCIAADVTTGVEGLNRCSFGLDGSVSTGVTLVSALLAAECAIIAVFGFQVRASVKRVGRRDTIMNSVWRTPRGALLFWLAMYCVWVPALYVCLLWTPDPAAFRQGPKVAVLVSIWPIWSVAAVSVVIPIWLYGRAIDYVTEDVKARRRAIWWEYEQGYLRVINRHVRCPGGDELLMRNKVLEHVRSRGKAVRMCWWVVMALLLLIVPILLAVFFRWGQAAVIITVSSLVLALCVRAFAWGCSWGKGQGVFLAVVAVASSLIVGVLVLLTMLSGVLAVPDLRLVVRILTASAYLLMTCLWMIVIMCGYDGARHPIVVTCARRVMRRSDELVWLRAQERRLALMGMGESAVKARLGGLRRAASRKRPSKRLRGERVERTRRNDKRC